MKNLFIALITLIFSSQAFATIGVSCGAEEMDIAYVYADPYIGAEFFDAPPVQFVTVGGIELDPKTVSVKMAEYDTKCEEEGYQGVSCRMYMKVDLNGNGKYEFEFEVYRQEVDPMTAEEGGVDYVGQMIDYRSGQPKYFEAACLISN